MGSNSSRDNTQNKSEKTLATVASSRCDGGRHAADKAGESLIFEMFDIGDQHNNGDERTSALSRVSYAKELRALGQVLEQLSVQSVDLQVDSGSYVVRGQVDKTKHSPFRIFVRDIASRLWSASGEIRPRFSNGIIDVRYSPQQLEKLDAEGRAQRRDPNKLPDPYGLSQKLRGVGFYLDNRHESSLLGVSVHDRWVTIRYGTVWQELEEAKQDVEFFYNYWVKMYLRRSYREGPPPKPSPPTYMVTDQEVLRQYRF